jgi:2-polyprenyl-6-methoxyphenol hydroxylase-like FAD-dependent oxidoreductase
VTHPGASAAPARTDVLIVGAGPTGLTLACSLATRGISHLLVERLAEGANTSRAAVVHSRTLEVLEEIEAAGRLVAAGIIVPRFTLRDRDRVLARIPFDRLPTRYPHTLMIPQQETERILLARLRELGGEVHRPWLMTGATQDAEGVAVTLQAEGQAPHTVQARYLVGADGMHSTVREAAGIGFSGERYEHSFVLADIRMSWPLSEREVALFVSPEGLVVVAPLPGGRHRVVATLDDAPEKPGIGDVQRLLDARGPTTGSTRIEEVVWSTRFRVHHRLADRYRAGRIVLAGDAAHVHSPAGGQGMNTGIQDAMALGRALSDGLAAGGSTDPIDQYERIRRPVAERVVGFTDRMTRMATLRTRGSRMVRNALLGVVGRIPAVRQWIATELAGLRNR